MLASGNGQGIPSGVSADGTKGRDRDTAPPSPAAA